MQIDIVRTNKSYKCRHCKEEIEQYTSCITRIGSQLKGEKRIYFHSRYHLRCFGKVLLDMYDEKRKPKKTGGGRPPILDVLTKDQRKRRHRVASYLTRDRHNLLTFYEEDNTSRILDTWFLIGERIEELHAFGVPFKLPWVDDKLARQMVRNDSRLALNLADQKIEQFPKIIWDYVRKSRNRE